MSKEYPIIAVTGSSGAGTSTVKQAFEHIFFREQIEPAIIEGDSFHKYNRAEMRDAVAAAQEKGVYLSHFGPDGNVFSKLEALFKSYGQSGTGDRRLYLHSDEEAEVNNKRLGLDLNPGEFTPWEPLPEKTDLLFYEGLHGGVAGADCDVAKHVDLLVGVVPIVNLEWIQKIHRDKSARGHSEEAIIDTILRRMYDYVHFITPQFTRTDINFQRVPTVDTSNPFIARDIPTLDESNVVIRFKDPDKFKVDFPYLLSMIDGSFMSRRNTIVVPGGKMGLSMEIILTPIIHNLVSSGRNRS